MVRWVEAGAGGPVVVLDAGLGEPATLAYAAVMPAVAERTRVIAYDRAGIGTSDPVSSVSVRSEIDDLAAVVTATGEPCVLAGHSWGGLLVQLLAVQHPELIAGLVLIDPADEIYWSQLPAEIHEDSVRASEEILERQAAGEVDALVREYFTSYIYGLTEDERVQALLFAAYASCFATKAQGQIIHDEAMMFTNCVPEIHQLRSRSPLPDVPVVLLSATVGAAPEHRAKWTAAQAEVARSVPRGTHIELPDTHHAINEFRPEAIVSAIGRVLDEIGAS
ncbi:MAG TPA: alpha/beta hydrolase [Streptosporangiaceae bacterium]|jgi:pimeloyl-ACP methyl ester carboxylesterase